MLEAGVDVEATDEYGLAPLLEAVMVASPAIVQLVIDYKPPGLGNY